MTGTATTGAPATGGPARTPAPARSWRPRHPEFLAILPATAVLFLISPLLAPGSTSQAAVLGMLPFAAVLAIAAVGQTLVIQQGGLDLSVPGMISLSAVTVSKMAAGDDDRLLLAVGVVALLAVAAGLVNGLAVTRLGITPLVATLGTNALLLGCLLFYTRGSTTATVPPALDRLARGDVLGVPSTVVVALVLVVAVSLVLGRTVVGRRFLAVGAAPRASHVVGLPVARYQVGTYVAASLCYAGAGVLLAGFLGIPSLSVGDTYLLSTIAAVVLGGTALTGGRGSVVATAVAAVFLTQLQQVVLGTGAPASWQLIIQGCIIAAGMGLRNVPWRRLRLPRASP